MCASTCAACPKRVNRPETAEGVAVWGLVQKLGGQWRYAQCGDGGAVRTGYDMGAVLAVAQAAGVCGRAVVELMPAIEAGALNTEKADG